MLYLHLGVLDRVFPGGEKAQEVGGVDRFYISAISKLNKEIMGVLAFANFTV